MRIFKVQFLEVIITSLDGNNLRRMNYELGIMNDNKKPRKYDAVLGGNNPPPVDGLVLGGIEGVKRRFDKANSEEEKINLFKEALKYSEAGEDWLFEIASNPMKKAQWFASALLLENKKERYQKKIIEHFTDFFTKSKNSLRWNLWKKEFFYLQLSLEKIDLSSLRLSGFHFNKINLIEANFSNAILVNIDLSEANLSNANFSNAELHSCNLSHANLRYVDFSGAILKNINFRKANFKRAKIEGLNFQDTDVRDANFSLTNYSRANFKGASSKGAKFSKCQSK